MVDKKRDKMLLALCKFMWGQIQLTWGNGWRCLGKELQRAIIAERVFYLFVARDRVEGYTVTPQEMCEYLTRMFNFCGIDEDGK